VHAALAAAIYRRKPAQLSRAEQVPGHMKLKTLCHMSIQQHDTQQMQPKLCAEFAA
jgi:hypothetical protein